MKTSSFLFLLIIISMIFYLTLNNSFYDKFIVTSGVVDTIEPNKLSNKSIDSYLKKTSYTKTVNNIISSSQAPSGYTLISSITEYVYDYLGPELTHDFSALSVKFGTCDLGSHSFVQITSLNDGFSQKLNAQRLVEWRNYSAFFNGHYVKIEVFEHNTDSNIFCDVERLVVTDTSHPQRPPCNAGSDCGNTATDDLDRVPSSHPAVARRMGGFLTSNPNYEGLLTSSSSTVWLTSNGGFASAGHVVGDTEDVQQVHFNIPFSSEDGAISVPSPDDQYAINFSTISRSYQAGNRDWAVFNVYPNPNTGLLPSEVQSKFLRVIRDEVPDYYSNNYWIGVKYGYGIDIYPSGTCGSLNSSSRTQQKATASEIRLSRFVTSESGTFLYRGVNEGGDSGGPIVVTLNNIEVSVGSNTNCGNSGTSFHNANFANALNDLPNANTIYIDLDHPSNIENGTIFSPHKTVVDGVSGATNWDNLSIVAGTYNEALTISKALTLTAPVGKVTIGATSPQPKSKGRIDETNNFVEEKFDQPMQLSLTQNYPNPFNPSTTISYSVPEDAHASITVYNTAGQEVALLTDKFHTSGEYSVIFNASHLSSGVYFYVLRYNGKELLKRMTLIK
jgi:hypothetical protein